MTFDLAPEQFADRKAAVEKQIGKSLPGDTGSIQYAGVTAVYAYVAPVLTVNVTQRPFPLTRSYVENRITDWFAK